MFPRLFLHLLALDSVFHLQRERHSIFQFLSVLLCHHIIFCLKEMGGGHPLKVTVVITLSPF